MSREGRSRQHSPQSFSGYCCSLHFTTQYSAQPQLASARDYAIFVCVGASKREGERVTDRQWEQWEESRSRMQGLQAAYRGQCVFILNVHTLSANLGSAVFPVHSIDYYICNTTL